ncbi:MAG: beta-ketoacyl-ACP synthase II [Peptostreptococcus porci]|uniref:3-oxoacyl-[acyl-carrier-protein] synthase 2 n=1 Tax=Peptostreptococcus porci TaxID=2652282 RepID=A0A6N7XFY8_9FIRM|nr:beta-ketoacyl-ACP synthase II [Peptostreptococcus porci]MDY5480038.1 beta-ketoacyl-ACP synthase II [Peptostreptococcus porci]MDY6231432.1 beta-ketoacyl-ACP synthase II [Peptostreptococcus porci]MST62523.1 beta-ketoacyl-ACP synthase II [Peptostreptococcus porci]
MDRRVVITGIGVISPIGNNIEDFLKNIIDCKNGIDEITLIDTSSYKTKLAAEVKDFEPKEFGIEGHKKKDRFVQFAIAAAKQAQKNSGYIIDDENRYKTGVVVGSGIGGLSTIQDEHKKFIEKGPRKISSHFIPKAIVNMAAGHVSIELGSRGVCTSNVTACATGTDSIGYAFRLVKNGYQDAVFAGGCEASICDLGILGFEAMSATSFSTDKNRASIPFDKERSGFVMGEGSAIMLLESLESALKRNANIICEVVGFGQTSDAYHITAPNPDGEGAMHSMKFAIEESGASIDDIDYVNAHGTSTPLNDVSETLAIKKLFGEHSKNIAVSSTKSMTGHMLGAAGAIEASICALALNKGFIPSTINYAVKDEECDLDYVTEGTRFEAIEYALSNSLGFGGHNSSLLFKKYTK